MLAHEKYKRRDSYDDGISRADKQAANERGWIAYHAGCSLDDNPYPYQNSQWRAWKRGMLQAEKSEAVQC